MRTLALLFLLGCAGGEPAEDLKWYATCGDPVCNTYSGPFEGVDLCTTEVPGDACATADAECDPVNDCNATLICASSDPTQGEGGCPISRRAYKHDIHYLAPTELDAVRKTALDLPVATWRYNGSDEAAAPRLGFIIDDRPTIPAVAVDGQHVDVYGLATMAIAAVQIQQQEIAALQARIAELEAKQAAGPR